jgi:hypothetical protein
VPVIDCDGHILERQSDIRKYLEPPWDRRPTSLWPGGDQPWDTELSGTHGYEQYTHRLTPAEQVEQWLSVMEREGIQTAVLFPSGSGNAAKLSEKRFAVAVCRAVNTHFARDYNALSDRIRVVGVLPMRQPEEAARELRRAVKELGLISFEILSLGLPVALGDSFFDPVYAAAEELGVPLCIHGNRNTAHEVGGAALETFSEVHTYVFPAAVMLHFTSIMAQGVQVRFPRLKLALLEIGATWLSYWLDRLDEHWELRGEHEMPLLKEKPSDIFRKSPVYVSVEPEETLLPHTIAHVGDDHFMFASDFPHWDARFPDNLHRLRGRKDLSEETREKLLYSNAKALFGL